MEVVRIASTRAMGQKRLRDDQPADENDRMLDCLWITAGRDRVLRCGDAPRPQRPREDRQHKVGVIDAL